MDPVIYYQDLFNLSGANLDLLNVAQVNTQIITVSGRETFTNLTPFAVIETDASSNLISQTLTNGQIIIGSTGVAPVAANLSTPNATLTITNGPGSIGLDLAPIVPNPHEFTGLVRLDNAIQTSTNAIGAPPATCAENQLSHAVMTSPQTWHLPYPATDGTVIQIVDSNNNFNTNNQTLIANGPGVINGADAPGTNTYIMNNPSGWYEFMFNSNSNRWTTRSNKNWSVSILGANNIWTGTNQFNQQVTITPATNQLVLGTGTTITINAVAPVSNRIVSLPDLGTNYNVVGDVGIQTINGAKTFGSAVTIASTQPQLIFSQAGQTQSILVATTGLASRVYTVPDPGSDSNFILSHAVTNQTINQPLILTSALSVTPVTNQIVLGTTNTTTINAVAPVASRTYTIPDTGANSSFVMTDLAQTINNVKSFSSVPKSDGLTSFSATTEMIFTSTNPAATFGLHGPAAQACGIYFGRNADESALGLANANGDYVPAAVSGDTCIQVKTNTSKFTVGAAAITYTSYQNNRQYVGYSNASNFEFRILPTAANTNYIGITPDSGTNPIGIYLAAVTNLPDHILAEAQGANQVITGTATSDLALSYKSGQSLLLGSGSTNTVKFNTGNTTSTTTGALQVLGGTYVQNDTLQGGQHYFLNVTAPTSGSGPACLGSLNTANTNGPQLVAFGNGDAANTAKLSLVAPRYKGFGTFAAVVLTNTGTFYKMIMNPATGGNRWSETATIGASGLGVFTAPVTGTYKFTGCMQGPANATAGHGYLLSIVKNPTFAAVDGNGSYALTGGTSLVFSGPILEAPGAASSLNGNVMWQGNLSAADTICMTMFSYTVAGLTCGSGVGTCYMYKAEY